jgi:uncharacterized membrane protein YeaQ/YmgE (transglycosylase-associated protein family)
MNIVIWLFVGGILGWIASIVMHTDQRQGIGMNVVVGIAGALIGGWIISPMIGGATINQGDFSGVGLMVSFAGAILLLVAVSLIQRRKTSKIG